MAFQRSLLVSGGRFASSAWKSYEQRLERQPVLTKILTGVVGTMMGDAIAQCSAGAGAAPRSAKHGGAGYDTARTARLAAYSAAVGTPLAHWWFGVLDKAFVVGAGSSAARVALTKMLLDQAIMAPIGIGLFFFCQSLLQGGGVRRARAEVSAKLRPTLVANYMLWPAANLVNFAFVPPAQRILYVNAVAVAWMSYLSAVAAKGHAHAA